jgi:hypothetical protein
MARSAIPDATAMYWVARRVEVPVWTDTWMRGDRYGLVLKLTRPKGGDRELREKGQGAYIAHVRLDKSGRTKKFRAGDLKAVD